MNTIIERRGHRPLTVNSELQPKHKGTKRRKSVAKNSQPGMYGANGFFKSPINSVERHFFASLDAMKSKPKRIKPPKVDSSNDGYDLLGIIIVTIALAIIFR